MEWCSICFQFEPIISLNNKREKINIKKYLNIEIILKKTKKLGKIGK